jgi:hypothetical protein
MVEYQNHNAPVNAEDLVKIAEVQTESQLCKNQEEYDQTHAKERVCAALVLDAEISEAELDARVHVALWVIQKLDVVDNYHAVAMVIHIVTLLMELVSILWADANILWLQLTAKEEEDFQDIWYHSQFCKNKNKEKVYQMLQM